VNKLTYFSREVNYLGEPWAVGPWQSPDAYRPSAHPESNPVYDAGGPLLEVPGLDHKKGEAITGQSLTQKS
jgi:hypothetical protein